jgi:hypothetical protein
MIVDVVAGRRCDRRMTELPRDDVEPNAGCEREFRVGMPRPVQPNRRDAGHLDERLPPPQQRVRVDYHAVRLSHDPRRLHPETAVCFVRGAEREPTWA